MPTIGFIPQNHEWCLQQLMHHEPEILKHFPDILPEFFGDVSIVDLIRPMSEEMARCGLSILPVSNDISSYFWVCADFFVQKDAYGTAFAIAVLTFVDPKAEEHLINAAFEWKKKILAHPQKYTKQMEMFSVVLRKMLKTNTLTKPAFDYFDQLLDDKYFHYLCEKQIKYDERNDVRLISLKKRWSLRYFPNGVIPYLYKILQIALHYLNMRRFKQVRHLLAVVAELMKTVNQDTQLFQKLRDMWFMIKTMHWATIIAVSELKEVLLKSPKLAVKIGELTKVENVVIDFGIALPDGEDPELPIDLVATEANRVPLYEKLKTYEMHLKRSKLPHIQSLYDSVLFCDINFYDANNGNPFCCGKHHCRHTH